MRRWDDHPKGPGLCFPAHVEPRQIAYVCQLTEAHQGLAVIRTIDEALGSIEFWVSPYMRETFEDFARSLPPEIGLRLGKPRDPTMQ